MDRIINQLLESGSVNVCISQQQKLPTKENYLCFRMKLSCSTVLILTIIAFAGVFETSSEFLISTNKPVIASSQFPGGETGAWEASRAVDGSNSTDPSCRCCAATKNETDPSLTVNLERAYEISRIVIYGRTDREYPGQNFAGLTIYLDASLILTIPQSGRWIYFYEHKLPFVQLASTVTLSLPGNYKQLVVCELLVYGDCQMGLFGSDCSESCGQCRNGEPCNKRSGYCSECSNGFDHADPLCKTECASGTYGRNCSEVCGQCRYNQTCDVVAGECTSCKDGYTWMDLTCKTQCPSGQYGSDCSETCGQCRDGESCSKQSGYCNECSNGFDYADSLCKTRCQSGRYGRNCSQVCGQCRNNKSCDAVDGKCTLCRDGYTWVDMTCKTRCASGTYGRNCSEVCGQCRYNQTCDVVAGECTSCKDGYTWMDITCKTRCPKYTYGYNCSRKCGMCKDETTCDQETGHCPNGCSEMFEGLECLQISSSIFSNPVFSGLVFAIAIVFGICILALAVYILHLRRQRNNREERGNANDVSSSAVIDTYENLDFNTVVAETSFKKQNK